MKQKHMKRRWPGAILAAALAVSMVSATGLPVLAATETVAAAEETGTEEEVTLSGGETITEGGTYKLADGATGTVTVSTTDPVVVEGSGVSWDDDYKMTCTTYSDLYFSCAEGADLTLQDAYISNNGSAPVVDFTGDGNHLSIEGTVVLDCYVAYAVIHVGTGTSLTIGGTGTLYLYKTSTASGIGGGYGELNGDITFGDENSSLTVFAKGSKMGALIGTGAYATGSADDVGTISFVEGTYNLVSVARGAAIGGGAGSDEGISEGVTVYVGAKANININVDYSGAAVGGGGYKGGNDASGGTLYITGGSLRCYIDANAAGNTTGWNGEGYTQGINDAAITAQRVNADNEAVYRAVFDTQNLAADAESYTVYADGEMFYQGGLPEYGYIQELLDKGEQLSVTSTVSNWYENGETCLYFYLTGEDHTLTVNGEVFDCTWDSETGSFTIAASEQGTTALTVSLADEDAGYAAGYSLTESDLTVMAENSDGDMEAVSGYTVSPSVLSADTEEITVTYGGSEATVPITVYDMTWYGDGTSTEYTISSKSELESLAHVANGTMKGVSQDSFSGKTISQNGNIVLEAETDEDGNALVELKSGTFGTTSYAMNTEYPVVPEELSVWTPIGGASATANSTLTNICAFAGTYDGCGYSVTGLYTDADSPVQGLFGYVTGAVENLTVSGCVTGTFDVAGIAAVVSGGTITNCVNNAIVFASGGQTADSGLENGVSRAGAAGGIIGNLMGTENSVSNCINNGYIVCGNTAKGGRSAGIVGLIDSSSVTGEITKCGNTADVDSYQYTGGICGYNASASVPISCCYNTGDVKGHSSGSTYVGGIVAYTSSSISNCYNTGVYAISIDGSTGTKAAHFGGIVSDLISPATVENCYNSGEADSGDAASTSSTGGICGTGYGTSSNNKLSNCYTTTGGGEDLSAGCVTYINLSTSTLSASMLSSKFMDIEGSQTPVLKWQYPELDTSVLQSISVTGEPVTSYVEGQSFDVGTLQIWACYSDGTSDEIKDYTVTCANGGDTFAVTDTTVVLSGTYEGTEFSFTYDVTVAANALSSIAITTQPNSVLYAAGEYFDATGMVVTAYYTNGLSEVVTADAVYSTEPLSAGTESVTVSYTYDGLKMTAEVAITVLNSAAPSVEDGTVQIENADHMLWYANQITNGNMLDAILLSDIDLSDTDFVPIGRKEKGSSTISSSFSGTFDGNGHTVTLNYSDTVSYSALFARITDGALIKNLTVDGAIDGSGSSAAVVGYMDGGSLENVVSAADVTGTSTYVGGIVGFVSQGDSITGCVNYGSVTSTSYNVGGIAGFASYYDGLTISNCMNYGTVSGIYRVGGIAGTFKSASSDGVALIENCGNEGTVTSTRTSSVSAAYGTGGIAGYAETATIDSCYNKGTVGGTMHLGGIVGTVYNADVIISNCYNQADIENTSSSYNTYSGGIVGNLYKTGATVINCYSTGSVSTTSTGSSARASAFIGYAANSELTNVSNNYVLEAENQVLIGYNTVYTDTNVAAVSESVLKTLATVSDGEETSVLGDAYVENSDGYPMLSWEETSSGDEEILNGLYADEDGTLAYYVDGVIDTTYTGIVAAEDGTVYYVESGYVGSHTGLAKDTSDGTWYYFTDSVLDEDYTGLVKNAANGILYYVADGTIDWTYTGPAKYAANGCWYYVAGGTIDWTYTGLAKNAANGIWYYFADGTLDWSYSGAVKHSNGVWYYVSGGQLDWNYTGTAVTENGTFTFKNGSIVWN